MTPRGNNDIDQLLFDDEQEMWRDLPTQEELDLEYLKYDHDNHEEV